MTAFQDYEIELGRRASLQRRIGELLDRPDDSNSEAAVIGSRATEVVAQVETELRDVGGQAVATTAELQALTKGITDGSVDLDDTRELLVKRRQHLTELAAYVESLGKQHADAQRTKADPKEAHAALVAKYGIDRR